VTLTFDLLTLESCHVMPLWWSIRVPSLNWIRLIVPELGRLQFSVDRQLKVPIFTFFGRKGGQISNLIFLTPKGTTMAETTYNDVLRVGMCPKMRPVGVSKKGKKRTETFMRQTGYLPRPPTSTQAPEILHAGSCPGSSYIFQVS